MSGLGVAKGIGPPSSLRHRVGCEPRGQIDTLLIGEWVTLGTGSIVARGGKSTPILELARFGIDGVKIDSLRGKQTGREVGHAILDHHPGADRPVRAETAVSEQTLPVDCSVEGPSWFAAGGVEAVNLTIVRADVGAMLPDRRRRVAVQPQW